MSEARTFRWSFSQWENYNECPQRWKFKSVMRLPTTLPGPAAARGLDMHRRCEDYIESRIDLPVLLKGIPTMRFGDKSPAPIHPKYVPILDAYKNHTNGDRWCEYEVAFDEEWHLCPPKGSTRSVMAVLDAVRAKDGVVHIGEWKSGKPKDTHRDQRMLYAVFGLKKWMSKECHVTTYYLEDTAPPQRLTVKEDKIDVLIDKWTARREQMKSDQFCAPRPGIYCRWCDFSKSKGGPCQFS